VTAFEGVWSGVVVLQGTASTLASTLAWDLALALVLVLTHRRRSQRGRAVLVQLSRRTGKKTITIYSTAI